MAKEQIDEQEVQQKMLIYQLMQKQLEELSQQSVMLEGKLVELESAMQVIDDINKTDNDNDALIPLGSGLYAHGSITGKSILTDIGAGVMVNSDFRTAEKLIDERKKEIEKIKEDLDANIKSVTRKLNEMLPELQEIAE